MSPSRFNLGLALLPILLIACGESTYDKPVEELVGSTMGTTFSVKIVEPPGNLDLVALQNEVQAALDDINQTMSTYIEDSALSRFNASESTDWQNIPGDLCYAIEAAGVVSEFTEGAFDVTVSPLVDLWGFGPVESRDTPPTDEEIDTLMNDVGYTKLEIDCSVPAIRKVSPGVSVDLSAFAKGHAVDLVSELLNVRGLPHYLVEIGGELRMRGLNAKEQPWAIAVESPKRSERSVQIVMNLSNAAMATSGDYRNYFEHDGAFYSHTIDPRTGRPISHNAASVTVVADTAAFADAAATALLVLGPDDGLELANRENIAALFLLRLGEQFEERMSQSFKAKVLGQ